MDTTDNPLKNDNEFIPNGLRNWNSFRYYYKLKQLAKALLSVAEWNEMAIIGLAEIENRKVLEDLIYYTPLRNFDYKIVHYDSPDSRGIDVALLYSRTQFTLLSSHPIPVNLQQHRSTRDILHVRGILKTSSDTLNLFINHWPSRWGGQVNSEWRRLQAAKTLLNYLDSTRMINSNTLIMGDFNDTPADASMQLLSHQNHWINLADSLTLETIGTHYYDEKWAILDQILISTALAHQTNNIQTGAMHIHQPEFLMRTTNATRQPLRSYRGMQYEGGFSDHLPVFVDLVIRKKKK